MNKNIKKVIAGSQINTSHLLREGESLEERLRRITISKEPIDTNQSPEIYQERNAGVDFACDIRTDRFAIAQGAMDTYTKTHMLARENKPNFGKQEGFTPVIDENGNIVQMPNAETE